MTLKEYADIIEGVVKGIKVLKEQGVDFETARILLVAHLGITMGEATREIELSEEFAGVKLDRAS